MDTSLLHQELEGQNRTLTEFGATLAFHSSNTSDVIGDSVSSKKQLEMKIFVPHMSPRTPDSARARTNVAHKASVKLLIYNERIMAPPAGLEPATS